MRVESRSFWSVGDLMRRSGWLGSHPSAAGRGWWVLWCGWWFLWLVFFCGLGLARGSAVAGGPRIQPEEARKQPGKEKEEKDKARANLESQPLFLHSL